MRPVIIAVAGGTGSGKTTVVQEIVQGIGKDKVAIIQHDSYYRDRSDIPLEERARINYDHPDSLDTDLLIAHLHQLRQGRPVQVPVYDFTSHTRQPETQTVFPRRVMILEGILILADPRLRELMDIKIFVDTDADIRFIRRLERDMTERGRTLRSVIEQYINTVRPMHLEFVEPSKRYADIIIPEGGFNRVAVDMVIVKIQSLIA